MTEEKWDKKLNILTIGRDESHADKYHHPYEPTPYSVLLRIAECPYINESSKVMDYGCGRGRVGFFLAHSAGCTVTGVEFDPETYRAACSNLERFRIKNKVSFICGYAENIFPSESNVFYFFNPFSVEILRSVMGKIIESYYDDPRRLRFFFYYPSDEYISYLMTVSELDFVDEIDCRDLFEGNNPRERVMIFEISDN